jgi:hypothetical protein
MSKNNQPSKKPYQKNIPIWKMTIIQVLKGTIGVLENTVVQLETDTPVSTEKKPNFLQRVLWSWDGLLRTFRLFLPSNVSNNLSDTILTGILVGVTVVIVGTTTTMFILKPSEVGTLPPVKKVTAPTPIPTVAVLPEPEITATPEPTPTLEATPTLEPKLEPEPIPTPILQLTPEQALIAAMEDQLAEISVSLTRNGEKIISTKLIKSIQANFRSSDLTVKIADDWYALETDKQNQLAADILQRSQELDFTHLEIIDSQDNLIARNPVVGNKMVILKRRNLIVPKLAS